MGHHQGARHTPVRTGGGDTATASDHPGPARGATAPGGADLLHRAQHGDRLAFEHLFLLTELPFAIPPGDLVADRDFAGGAPRSRLPRLGLQVWSDRARYRSRAVEDGWRAIGFEMLPR